VGADIGGDIFHVSGIAAGGELQLDRRDLVAVPSVEPLHVLQTGKYYEIVVSRDYGRIDALYGEIADLYLVSDEVGEETVAGIQAKQPGQFVRNHYSEAVRPLGSALEQDSVDVFPVLYDTGPVHRGNPFPDIRDRVDESRFGELDRGVFAHVIKVRGRKLDVAGQCRDAFPHFRAETGGDGNGNYNNKERDSYGHRSYPSLKFQTFRYETCRIHLPDADSFRLRTVHLVSLLDVECLEELLEVPDGNIHAVPRKRVDILVGKANLSLVGAVACPDETV